MGDTFSKFDSNEEYKSYLDERSNFLCEFPTNTKFQPANKYSPIRLSDNTIRSRKSSQEDYENVIGRLEKLKGNQMSSKIKQIDKNPRSKFYNKLIQLKELPTDLDIKTIIIFDWDDTLFCTNEFKVRHRDKTLDENNFRDKLLKLDVLAFSLVTSAIKLGHVYIVTNARMSWVSSVSEVYMPMTNSLLQSIKIISARDEYFDKFPAEMRLWKLSIFKRIAEVFKSEKYLNIVSLGDSDFEIEAPVIIKKSFDFCLVKTVKLIAKPSLKNLIKQLKVLLRKLPEISKKEKSSKFDFSNLDRSNNVMMF